MLSIELGYFVPDGAQLRSMEEMDRAGIRIGVTQGSTSQTTLPKYLALASVVPVANVVAAREKLSRGELEAFATNKAILFELADGMPGSTVLAGNWGVKVWPSRFRREEMQVLLICGDLWRMRRSLAWCRVLALALAFAEPPLPPPGG